MRITLAALLIILSTGCDDCSDRAQQDLRSLTEVSAHLEAHYAPSWDAGVAELARLEATWGPAVALTAAALAAEVPGAKAISADDTGAQRVRVEGGAEAVVVLDALFARRLRGTVQFDDAGVELRFDRPDLTAWSPGPHPPWTPASPDGLPCFSACRERQARLLESTALLTRFEREQPRLPAWRRLDHLWKDEAPAIPTGVLRETLHRLLREGLPAGTSVYELREGLAVRHPGWSLEACQARAGEGVTCAPLEVCSEHGRNPGCSFLLSVGSTAP